MLTISSGDKIPNWTSLILRKGALEYANVAIVSTVNVWRFYRVDLGDVGGGLQRTEGGWRRAGDVALRPNDQIFVILLYSGSAQFLMYRLQMPGKGIRKKLLKTFSSCARCEGGGEVWLKRKRSPNGSSINSGTNPPPLFLLHHSPPPSTPRASVEADNPGAGLSMRYA